MPVGSHKDAFKTHQLAKKLADRNPNAVLAGLVQEILLDFVKNARQVNAERTMNELPEDSTQYNYERCDQVLAAVEGLCGKCDESHDDSCFVNQARRVLIKIKTNVDLGSHFDGKKSLDDLLNETDAILKREEQARNSRDDVPSQAREGEEEQADEPVAFGLGAQVAALERRYRESVERDLFRSTLIDEIVATITQVVDGNFAAEMPVHDDAELGKLATAFNIMLETINRTMRHLDGLVAERSANLGRIMNTVPVGLLSLDEQLRVNPEYSAVCETILGVENLRGRHFADVIGLTKSRSEERSKLEEFLDLLCQRILPEQDMAPLNPIDEWQLPERDGVDSAPAPSERESRRRPRLQCGRWIRTNFHLIDRGAAASHILVILEDITSKKEMAAEIAKADRENMQLQIIAEDPDLFCEFLSEARKILVSVAERLVGLSMAADPSPFINEMFRGVHTLKGTGATLGLDNVSRLAAGLEDQFSLLRDAVSVDPEVECAAGAALLDLRNALEEVVARTSKLLGHGIGDEDDAVLRISARALSAQMEKIEAMAIPEAARREILAGLNGFRLVPARKGLGRALRIVPALVERLYKEVSFAIDGEETLLDLDVARILNTPLVHLFRNALDHGIEPPEEREAVDKPPEGSLRLVIWRDDGVIELRISDDGRGLDPARLRDKAVAKGLLTEAEAEALDDAARRELIFLPGFSTAEEVSDVSGRGVGMDAVLAAVRDDLGGSVAIESALGAGTTFIIRVPAAGRQS